jgi:predicted regulator of Ras-like GTPase activity (Roadblock/LC7/MglB family)
MFDALKEAIMAIEKILKFLEDVKGYLGSGVFTPQGELLGGVTDVSGIKFEEAGSMIHDALSDSKKMTKEVGLGSLDMLQLYTQMGIIFAVCHDDGIQHFHTIMIIKSDGNVAMAKLKLKKAVEALKSVF